MKSTRKINYMTFKFEIVSAVKWFKHLDLRSLDLCFISFDRVGVLICSVAIFC
jgi:hypothetical protein